MAKIRLWGISLAAMVFAAGLAGCGSGDLASLKEGHIEAAVIGADSGSGDLESRKKSFEADAFERIQVDSLATEIEVRKGTGDRAEVELLTDKSIRNQIAFDASVQSGILLIRENEEGKASLFGFRGQKGQRKLLVTLPEKGYEEFRVNNEFGYVDVSGLKAEAVNVKVSAGEIRLRDVSGELDLHTEAGNITALDLNPERGLSVSTAAGSVEIGLSEAPKAAAIDLLSEVGAVKADLAGMDYDVKAGNRIKGSIGLGGPRIEAETQAGDIRIHS